MRSEGEGGEGAKMMKYELTATMVPNPSLDPIELVRVEFWIESFDEVESLCDLLGLLACPPKIILKCVEVVPKA